jgi:hypothetical protein
MEVRFYSADMSLSTHTDGRTGNEITIDVGEIGVDGTKGFYVREVSNGEVRIEYIDDGRELWLLGNRFTRDGEAPIEVV